jgi:sialate O-acetylesterase
MLLPIAMLRRVCIAAAFFPPLLPAQTASPSAGAAVRGGGWDYDRAEFFEPAEKIAAARVARREIRLTGWIEFDVTVAETGWHGLFLGGVPAEWARDLFVDGKLIHRLAAAAADVLPGTSAGRPDQLHFKEASLHLAAGRHTLRFQRLREKGALPTVWELRPAPPREPAAAIHAGIIGPRIVEPGESVTLRVTAGGSGLPAVYEFRLRDELTGAESAAPAAALATGAGPAPVVRDLPVVLAGAGLYTLTARVVPGEPVPGGPTPPAAPPPAAPAPPPPPPPAAFKPGAVLAAAGAARSRPAAPAPAPEDFAAAPLLAQPFCGGAVLQREKPLPVWGWARPGETVTVTLAGRTATATAAAPDGRWQVTFEPLPAGGPHTLAATAAPSGKTAVAKDVFAGEVWLLSGQSNMGGALAGSTGGAALAGAASLPAVRIAHIHGAARGRLGNVYWQPAVSGGDPRKMEKWPAIHYAFGARLHEKLGVPVGLLSASRGGTAISTWTSLAAHRAEPSFAPLLAHYEAALADGLFEILHIETLAGKIASWKKNGAAGPPPALPAPRFDFNAPGFFHRELIEPLAPFAIRGVLWYQGEADGGAAAAYRARFPAMIRDWRALWGDPALPFIYAQISHGSGRPSGAPPGDSDQAELREAQTLALSVPGTAMIVTHDLIRPDDDVHYKDKLPVGRRFALAALSSVYGDKTVEAGGPVYRGMEIAEGAVRLSFDRAAGLRTKDGAAPGGFAIAGADKKWVWAGARIDGGTVVVSSPAVPKPVAVRYGWSAQPCGANLVNGAGLPAPTFRTDDWPLLSEGRPGFRRQ